MFLAMAFVFPDPAIVFQYPRHRFGKMGRDIDKLASGMGITQRQLVLDQHTWAIATERVTHYDRRRGRWRTQAEYLVDPFPGMADVGLVEHALDAIGQFRDDP